MSERCSTRRLVGGGLIVAGLAAGFAIHEPVVANADIDYSLAQAAELLAFTLSLWLFALRAAVFSRAGSGAHAITVARGTRGREMTLVMAAISKSRHGARRSSRMRFLRAL